MLYDNREYYMSRKR